MSESITFNNAVYVVPDVGESSWGQNLTNYLVAIPQGCYQLSGGTVPLTADLSFGASFGLMALYLKSVAANIAQSGVVRLANTDTIAWRNYANGADIALSVDSSNRLSFSGSGIVIPLGDVVVSTAGNGFVVKDDQNGNNYRIRVSGGVLGAEPL